MALKAALINNPPSGVEGQLYAEISRSKPAPQGICVANSAGKVLAWTLSFDKDAAIGQFLDYAGKRYQEFPDAERPVPAERFMQFPGNKLASIDDPGRTLTIPKSHSADDRCPAIPQVERGTLVGRIVGRPLNENGQPIEKTARQEDYMEARFEIPVEVQRNFLLELANAPADAEFAVPPDLARQLVSHAYLGQLDVNPLGGRQTGGRTNKESIEFHARRFGDEQKKQVVRITGTSNVAGGPSAIGIGTDGRSWDHQVELEWEGYLDIEGERITGLVLLAEGKEKLQWGGQRLKLSGEPTVAHLMAGHAIDLDCNVRYGLTAIPSDEREIVDPSNEQLSGAQSPNHDQQTAMRQQIQRLRAAGQDKQADRMERALQQSGQPNNAIPLEQRLAHLREAVKHLRAAGATDIADQIAKQVQQIEQQFKQDRENAGDEPKK